MRVDDVVLRYEPDPALHAGGVRVSIVSYGARDFSGESSGEGGEEGGLAAP